VLCKLPHTMAQSMKTGITVSPNLLTKFVESGKSGADRFIQVQIINNDETLESVLSEPASGTWEADFDKVPQHLHPKQACFVLYRTDKQNSENKYMWYMLCFVPDTCPVRQKMLYASTRHTLRADLGQYNFIDEIHGTDGRDFSSQGYQEYYTAKTSEAPLTEGERIKKEEKEASYNDYIVGNTGALPTPSASRGVSFPVDDQVFATFDQMKSKAVNYMRLIIDVDAEMIKVDFSGSVRPAELGAQVPTTDCAFHFYMWSHTHEGNHLDTLIFAFSCPDGSGGTKSAPVRSRMLYASSKQNVSNLGAQRGLECTHKMEISNGGDFAENEYASVIHPVAVAANTGFKKPVAPGRGARKLVTDK